MLTKSLSIFQDFFTNWLIALSFKWLSDPRGVSFRDVRVVDLESLFAVGLNPARDFGFFTLKLAYGTLVVLLRCPFVPEAMHLRGYWGLPPLVNLESHHLSFTVLVRHRTQLKNKFNVKLSLILVLLLLL